MRYIKGNWKPTMRRLCKDCEKMFMPTGKTSKLCEPCSAKRKKIVYAKINGRQKNTRKEKV